MTGIHYTACVSPLAQIGDNVEIGPFSIIFDNVIIGDRVKIGAYCELGYKTLLGDGSPLVIGSDSLIRSHSVFYESSKFGNCLTTGHRVTVRENTIAGLDFQIGTSTEIQGDCQIGDFVRFQSNVFVGKKTKVGNFVRVAPYVVLTNDPTPPSEVLIGCTIEDFVSIAAAAVILPGVIICRHAVVAAQSCVTTDVPAGMVVAGVPARLLCEAKSIKLRDGSERAAYPWTLHFRRGFPDDITKNWTSNTD
jgi:UDP-3-O-[3-hydroxymyristoyl] glucosamine N-acyltransferase